MSIPTPSPSTTPNYGKFVSKPDEGFFTDKWGRLLNTDTMTPRRDAEGHFIYPFGVLHPLTGRALDPQPKQPWAPPGG